MLFQLVKAVAETQDLEVPKALKAPGGIVREGIIRGKTATLYVDHCHPTIEPMTERRPDLIAKLHNLRRAIIFEVAVSWEPRVTERTTEKKRKYQALAADLAKRWKEYRIMVIPVVIGSMGLVTDLRSQLDRANIFDPKEITKLMGEMQREALCGAVRIIKRHMVTR